MVYPISFEENQLRKHFFILYSSDPESFLSSDTCPETPDGSLKEEVDSPDNGAYICLWDLCHEEFETQKSFVDHLSDAHTETKKGCDEFPCLWKVTMHFCFDISTIVGL
jgi:hypothetical protein